MGLELQLWRNDRPAHVTQAMETSGKSVCDGSMPLFWRVKTIRHLYCPFPGSALTHPVYWKEFNRRQLGPYRAWSRPKSLALFHTGCSLHALSLSLPLSRKLGFCFRRPSLLCYSHLKWITNYQSKGSLQQVTLQPIMPQIWAEERASSQVKTPGLHGFRDTHSRAFTWKCVELWLPLCKLTVP